MGNKCTCLEGEEVVKPKFEVMNDSSGSAMSKSAQLAAAQEADKVEHGPVVLEGGLKYSGQWRGPLREGHGILERPDGGRYEGQFVANKAHGRGKLSHVNGDTYEGEWFEDRAQGHGKFVHQDGSSYEGQWHQDMQQGYGVEQWADNSRFEGTYWFSKKHGQGKFYWAEGSTYDGEFVENDIHGSGEYRWFDGRVYIGEWHRNHIHGTGRMQWSDGRLYEGNYYEDRKHGTGCFTWPDGRRYDGQWKDGKQHGFGRYMNTNQKVRHGEWKEGKRVRWVDEEHDPEPDTRPRAEDVATRCAEQVREGGVTQAGTWRQPPATTEPPADSSANSMPASSRSQATMAVANDAAPTLPSSELPAGPHVLEGAAPAALGASPRAPICLPRESSAAPDRQSGEDQPEEVAAAAPTEEDKAP